MKTEANETAHPFHPEGYEPELGLTKREYFAARVFPVFLGATYSNDPGSADDAAKGAVMHADALIAALNAPKAQL